MERKCSQWHHPSPMSDTFQGGCEISYRMLYWCSTSTTFGKSQYWWHRTQWVFYVGRKRNKRAGTVGEAVSWMLEDLAGLRGAPCWTCPALEWVEASQNPSWQSWWERKGRLRKATLEGAHSVWEMVTGNSFCPGQRTYQKTLGECHSFGQETSGLLRKRMKFEHRHICDDSRVGSKNVKKFQLFGGEI